MIFLGCACRKRSRGVLRDGGRVMRDMGRICYSGMGCGRWACFVSATRMMEGDQSYSGRGRRKAGAAWRIGTELTQGWRVARAP